ncbi:pseudouridine synthase [Mycoplasma enhydrae]|uniref:pseudouridine synthase n=1 Tax=Mycoplasma enhydrae TaxID=2499220 RepID=UPI0021E91AB1|nr:pseudouridine synthase [Mycoplasma enhydrae]MCV3753669.1 pseudouridine synthase [Mycoplasma enhydrae]
MKYRIEKILCSALSITRQEAKKFLRSDRIKVNGAIINKTCNVDATDDLIMIDDEIITFKQNYYYMFNKPSGCITANYDRHQETIFDLLELDKNKFFAIGRLDKDTEGLLIISNDGKLGHKISSPKSKIPKKYFFVTKEDMNDLLDNKHSKPITISNGYVVNEYHLELIDKNSGYLTIYEGKFHQVKEMLAFLGYTISYLKRISIGSLELDDSLELGHIKELSEEEIEMVFK